MRIYRNLGLLCASLLLLGWQARTRPATGTPHPSTGSPSSMVDGDYDDPSFSFRRVWNQKQSKWELSFRFKELNDEWKEVTCSIDDSASRRLDANFGYTGDELSRQIEQVVDEEAGKSKILDYGRSKASVTYDRQREEWITQVVWVPIPGRVLIDEDQRMADDEQFRFNNWYKTEGGKLRARAMDGLRIQRGFLRNDIVGWVPDYLSLIDHSAPLLKNCTDALDQKTGGNAEILVRFFQEMRYMPIDLVEDKTGKSIGGLRLPPFVMISGRGDCDSKAATFCAIQRKYNQGLVIFLSFVPKGDNKHGHALIGIDPYGSAKPEARPKVKRYKGRQTIWLDSIVNKPVQIGLHYYSPCEVAGPGAIPFGTVSPGKEGYYVVMPIQ
jgi:hypothetical protein